MVVAPTQTGKTTRIVIPTVLTWTGPLVVTSVKTDVLNLTHAERARRGVVHVFDPSGSTGLPGTRWSPLLGCGTYPGAERAAAWLAEAATETRPGENTAFWEALACKLLAPLMFAAASSGAGIDQVGRWVDRRTTTEVTQTLQLLGDTDAVDAWAASCARDDRARDSVYSTAEAILRAFASPTARAATTTDADARLAGQVLDVDTLIRRGDTLYLVAPAHEQQRLRPLFQALVQDVIRAAQDAYATTGVPLDPPLLLMLDEAANIAPLRDLALHAATGAGQGIQICSVWQDLAQVSTVYGRKAPTVINGHTARVFLPGSADLATLEATSKMIGDHEHTRATTTHAADGTQSLTSASVDARVAPVEYLRQLPADTAVVLHGRDPVLRLHTTPWWDDPQLRALVDPAAAAAADKAAQPTRTAGSRRLRVPRCPRGRPPDPSTDPAEPPAQTATDAALAPGNATRPLDAVTAAEPAPTPPGQGENRHDVRPAIPAVGRVHRGDGDVAGHAPRTRAPRRGPDRPLHRHGRLRGSRRPGPSRRERRSRPRGPPGRRGRVPRRHRVPRRPPRHPHADRAGCPPTACPQSPVADRSASLRTVAGHLATAAAATRFIRDRHIGEPTLTSGVELVAPMRRRTPPQAGETPGQLLDQALTSARRLRLAAFRDLGSDVPGHHSGRTLAIVASTMVTSHALELRLIEALRIAQRAADVSTPDLLVQLDNALALTKAGATAWSQVHRQWAGVRGLPSAENDVGVRVDAADLVHQLDALADRLHRSQTGEDRLPPRTSSPVDPVVVDPLRLARDLHSLQEVQQQLAMDHARLSAALGSAKRLFVRTSALNDAFDVPRRWSPAPPQCLSALADAYREAGNSMRGEGAQRRRDARPANLRGTEIERRSGWTSQQPSDVTCRLTSGAPVV